MLFLGERIPVPAENNEHVAKSQVPYSQPVPTITPGIAAQKTENLFE